MRLPRRNKEVLDDLERLVAGEMSRDEAARMAVLVTRSEEAQAAVARLKAGVDLIRAAGQEVVVTEHISSNELAEYIAGEGSAVERGRREAHLADCSECRAAFVRAAAAYSVYEAEVGARAGFGWNLRRWIRPALLALVPGTCLGLYVLGYFLKPYDPAWVHGITNSPWVQIIGAGSGIYAIIALSRNRY
ncbi:MAG: hypothetical protein AMXMBFR61_25900 [Fimbriimonadales bacterium]